MEEIINGRRIIFVDNEEIEIDKNYILLSLNDSVDKDKVNSREYFKTKDRLACIYIDFEKIEKDYSKLIKEIIKFIKKSYNKEKRLEINIKSNKVLAIVRNYNKKDYSQTQVIDAIKAMTYIDIRERYSYIYDRVCDFLNNEFFCNNLCEFKDDKCIAKKNTDRTMGCCHHYKNILDKNLKLCEYQKNKTCTADCITCKMFTCDYLREKGYKYNVNNILLLKDFFNITQRIILSISFFKTKETILNKLEKARYCL